MIRAKIVADITRRYSKLLHLYRDVERRNSRRGFGSVVAVALLSARAAKLENRPPRVRGARGSDLRLLRLTMDGLLDRTCGERPRASRIGSVPRLDLPED